MNNFFSWLYISSTVGLWLGRGVCPEKRQTGTDQATVRMNRGFFFLLESKA